MVKYISPVNILFVSKTSSRRPQDMSSRRLQDVFSVTIFCLPRRFQDILQGSRFFRVQVFQGPSPGFRSSPNLDNETSSKSIQQRFFELFIFFGVIISQRLKKKFQLVELISRFNEVKPCSLVRSSRPEVFCKKGILRNFAKLIPLSGSLF